jgi:hypothetical protein
MGEVYNPAFTDDIFSKILMLTKTIDDSKLKRYVSLLEDEIALARNTYQNMKRELRYYKDREAEFDKLKSIKDGNKQIKELTKIVNDLQRGLKDKDTTINRLYTENKTINKFLKQVTEQEEEQVTEVINYDETLEPQDETKMLKKGKEKSGIIWTKPVKTGWK